MRFQIGIIIMLSLSIILSVGHSSAEPLTTDSSDWTRVTLAPGSAVPPPRVNPGMVYDPIDGYILLYGGWNNVSNYLGDTWIFSHDSWAELNLTVTPGPRSSFGMGYDPADGYVLLYGGVNDSGPLNDTWAFHDGSWTKIVTSTAPQARQDFSMVYDAADAYIMVFGGVNEASQSNYLYYNDTWTYKSGQWNKLTTSEAPSSRGAQAMVYDSSEGYTLLFGGSTDYFSVNGGQSDTWKYQGGAWTQLHPSGSPDHRDDLGLVWDPAIAGDLFYGGWDPAGTCGNAQNDTRIYRDSTWRQLQPTNSPGERMAYGMDYDPGVGAVILFGGQDNIGAGPESGCGTPVILNDTWQFSLSTPSNNTQNTASFPNLPYLMYGTVAGLVASGGLGTFFGWRRISNGKKHADSNSLAPSPRCEKCGTVLPQESAYCGKCGHQLRT